MTDIIIYGYDVFKDAIRYSRSLGSAASGEVFKDTTRYNRAAAGGEDLGSNDFIKAGVKSFMVSLLGSATGSAAEGVFKSSVVGEAVSAGYSNGMGELTDYHMQE